MPEAVRLAVTNPPKALIALVAMIVITILMVTDSIGSDAGTGMLGSIVVCRRPTFSRCSALA